MAANLDDLMAEMWVWKMVVLMVPEMADKKVVTMGCEKVAY